MDENTQGEGFQGGVFQITRTSSQTKLIFGEVAWIFAAVAILLGLFCIDFALTVEALTTFDIQGFSQIEILGFALAVFTLIGGTVGIIIALVIMPGGTTRSFKLISPIREIFHD